MIKNVGILSAVLSVSLLASCGQQVDGVDIVSPDISPAVVEDATQIFQSTGIELEDLLDVSLINPEDEDDVELFSKSDKIIENGVVFHEMYDDINGGLWGYSVAGNPDAGDELGIIAVPAVHAGLPVIEVEQYGFYGFDMNGIILPEGLIHIADSAFAECSNLDYVEIPRSIEFIGFNSFINVRDDALFVIDLNPAYLNIESSGIPETASFQWGDMFAIRNKEKEAEIVDSCILTLNEDGSEYSVFGDGRGVNSLGTVYVPAEHEGIPVNEVSFGAFDGYHASKIFIEDGVQVIGGGVFSDCSLLEYVEIPFSVTDIGVGAFSGCPSELTISIDNYQDAVDLSLVDVPDGATVEWLRTEGNCYCG